MQCMPMHIIPSKQQRAQIRSPDHNPLRVLILLPLKHILQANLINARAARLSFILKILNVMLIV